MNMSNLHKLSIPALVVSAALAVVAFSTVSNTAESKAAAQVKEQDMGYSLAAPEKIVSRAYTGIQPVSLDLDFAAPADTTLETVRISAVLKDADGRKVDAKESSISVTAASKCRVSFIFQPPDYGFYSADVTASDPGGKTLASYSTGYAVLRPLTRAQQNTDPDESIFGVNIHFDHGQGDLIVTPKLLNMAGMKWIRDSIYWQKVEKTPGQYSMPAYNKDAYTTLLKDYGIHTLGILAYDNPKLYPHRSAEEAAAYGKYAEYVSKNLAGVVSHFEIWNEPNNFAKLTPAQYIPVLESGYQGVKKGNSKAFVVGIGGSSPGGWGQFYISEIRKQNAAGYMDSFSVHPYTSPYPGDLGYRTKGGVTPLAGLEYGSKVTLNFANDIKSARKLRQAPGIWITEIGWPSNAVGLKAQAEQIARTYVTVAAYPDVYQRVFIYDFICDGTNPNGNEHNFGMIGYDYSIRPAYVAAAAASRALEGRPFIKRLESSDDSVRLYLFGSKDDPLIVGWITEVNPGEMISGALKNGEPLGTLGRAGARPDRKIPVRLRVDSDEVAVRNWQDQEKKQAGRDLTLELTTSPIYIYNVGPANKVKLSR